MEGSHTFKDMVRIDKSKTLNRVNLRSQENLLTPLN
jgi:hypothetical protein